MNPVEDLLSYVARFAVADGAALYPALDGKVTVINVLPIAGDAGLDTRALEGLPATGTTASGFDGAEQFVGDRFQRCDGNKQIEALSAQARMVHQVNLTKSSIGDFDGGINLHRNCSEQSNP